MDDEKKSEVTAAIDGTEKVTKKIVVSSQDTTDDEVSSLVESASNADPALPPDDTPLDSAGGASIQAATIDSDDVSLADREQTVESGTKRIDSTEVGLSIDEDSKTFDQEDEQFSRAVEEKRPKPAVDHSVETIEPIRAPLLVKKHGLKQKIIAFCRACWSNRYSRYGVLSLVSILLCVFLFLPSLRYGFLSAVGVRVSAKMTFLDEKNRQPLSGVEVSLQGKTAKSNDEGMVRFSGLKLGKANLEIKKRAYATKTKEVTLGWGSNPLDDIELNSTGTRFSFELTDWLSEKPIAKGLADVSYLDSTVSNTEKGIAELAIEPTDKEEVTVSIAVPGYQEVKHSLKTDTKDTQKIVLVSSERHYYLSKRSGKYDLYGAYLDGTDERLILAGTGQERDDLVLSVSSDGKWLALVSTRDAERNKDGFLKSSLVLIDVKDSAYPVKKLATSERIQLVNWYQDRLVYVRVAEGASATNPKRHRLITYNVTGGETEIAASNYFNDVLATKSHVFFAPSNAYQESPQPFLFRVNPDGSEKQKIFDKETWNIFRTAYDSLTVAYQQEWYSLSLNGTGAKKLDGQPANLQTRLYVDAKDGKLAFWQEERDGKGVLLSYDTGTKKDTVVMTASGLSLPIRVVNDAYVIYRISKAEETADYIISLDALDKPGRKIKDVSRASAIDRWYYY
jgi:hypothetical protein